MRLWAQLEHASFLERMEFEESLGEPPLDAKTIYATGLALGHSLQGKTNPKVLLGRDTRESSPWIAATMAAALRHTGVRVESAGVVPTPAVAFLVRRHGMDAGVVISASHNPWRDNGIKLFGPDGFKLPDAVELAIEDEIRPSCGDGGCAGGEGPATGGGRSLH